MQNSTNRNPTIDIARGFTVFIMPSVHAVMIYSLPAVKRSWLGSLISFLAEGPGAELFMLLMGMVIPFSKPRRLSKIFYRVAMLLFIGYLLNLFKFIIPLKTGIMPESLPLNYGFPAGSKGMLELLLMGDILQQAAFAYLVVALLYKLPRYAFLSIVFAFVVAGISPWLWDAHSVNPCLDYLLTLCTGQPPKTFFPVLPWLTYSLTGLALGYYIRRYPPSRFYPVILVCGIACIVAGKWLESCEAAAWERSFYRTGPAGTFYHIGLVLLWLCLCRLTVKWLKNNFFLDLLNWLSRYITRIYFIQWVIICWMIPVFGYARLRLAGSLSSMLIVTILSFLLTKLTTLRRESFLKYHLSWKK
jgi:uncharacterized membrane protein